MITIQNYVRAQSPEEAYQLNQKRGSRILGGMLWTKMARTRVVTAIDLCDLGLDKIEETKEEFIIGAMVTLRQLELHEGLARFTGGAAAAALRDIVGVQFRNLATVGGSLWGRYGFSDVLTLLLSLDCSVELYRGGLIPLEVFAGMKPDRDLLLRVRIRKTPVRVNYRAFRLQRTDLPVLNCAVSELNGEFRAVIGARPGRGVIVRDTEGILSAGLTEASAAAFAEHAARSVRTGTNSRAGAAYRKELIRVLVRRALAEEGGWL